MYVITSYQHFQQINDVEKILFINMQKITMLLDCGKLKNRVIIIYDLLLILFQQRFNYLDGNCIEKNRNLLF